VLFYRRRAFHNWEHAAFGALYAALLASNMLDSPTAAPSPSLADDGFPPLGVVLPIVCAVVHILLFLLQRWSLQVQCAVQFTTTPPHNATHLWLRPRKSGGRAGVVPIQRSSLKAGGWRFVEFQKRKLVISEVGEEGGKGGGGRNRQGGGGRGGGLDGGSDGGSDGSSGDDTNPQALPPTVSKLRYPSSRPAGEYLSTRGLEGGAIAAVGDTFGANKLAIPVPSFWTVYQQHLTSPVCTFQVLCVLLWMLDEYWVYSVFTLMTIFGFEATMALCSCQGINTLRQLDTKPHGLATYRDGRWQWLTSHDALPGDIISISVGGSGGGRGGGTGCEYTMPCDAVLVEGHAVANEAALSGESVPQLKEALGMDDAEIRLDMERRHRVHVLFAGCVLLQTSKGSSSSSSRGAGDGGSGGAAECDGEIADDALPTSLPPCPFGANGEIIHDDDSSDHDHPRSGGGGGGGGVGRGGGEGVGGGGGCVAVVLRTGFGSMRGKLARRIEAANTMAHDIDLDAALLIGVLLLFAIASASYVLYVEEGRSEGLAAVEVHGRACVISPNIVCVLCVTFVNLVPWYLGTPHVDYRYTRCCS
jgi:hypothetical protein